MAERYKVADVEELSEDNSRVIVEIEGGEIAVFHIDGEYYAVANYCIHQAGPLCEGNLRGRMTPGEERWEWEYDDREINVVCPWHGWMFDVTTGKSIDDDRYTVPTYDIEVSDGEVFVLR